MKKDMKLYNVLFPVWMLVTMPYVWYLVIPGNFVIDSLVLVLAMAVMKLENRMKFYKKHILKVFLLGFLADLLAAVPMWGLVYLELGGTYGDSPILTVPGVLLAMGLLYGFSYFISFRDCEPDMRKKLSVIIAVATAPYTFLIPSGWIYGI